MHCGGLDRYIAAFVASQKKWLEVVRLRYFAWSACATFSVDFQVSDVLAFSSRCVIYVRSALQCQWCAWKRWWRIWPIATCWMSWLNVAICTWTCDLDYTVTMNSFCTSFTEWLIGTPIHLSRAPEEEKMSPFDSFVFLLQFSFHFRFVSLCFPSTGFPVQCLDACLPLVSSNSLSKEVWKMLPTCQQKVKSMRYL